MLRPDEVQLQQRTRPLRLYTKPAPTEAIPKIEAEITGVHFAGGEWGMDFVIVFDTQGERGLGTFFEVVPAIYDETDPRSADLRALVRAVFDGNMPSTLQVDGMVGNWVTLALNPGAGRWGRVASIAPYTGHIPDGWRRK